MYLRRHRSCLIWLLPLLGFGLLASGRPTSATCVRSIWHQALPGIRIGLVEPSSLVRRCRLHPVEESQPNRGVCGVGAELQVKQVRTTRLLRVLLARKNVALSTFSPMVGGGHMLELNIYRDVSLVEAKRFIAHPLACRCRGRKFHSGRVP